MSGNGSPVEQSAREDPRLATRRASEGPTLYLVAPESLESWFSCFVEHAPGDEVVFTGEDDDVDSCAISVLFEAQSASTVVVCSSHETLARDHELARKLRRLGARTIAPSATSARLGADKVRMKEFFDRRGFATTPWSRGDDLARLGSAEALVVVKLRRGTQSVGTRLARLGDCALREDEFCELYVDGVEYSVVLYRDEEHELIFPPVWKGETSHDLVPPWKRLRMCPYPRLGVEREHGLRDTARAIAREIDMHGYLEVECLVTERGDVLVLEINPRIAGTMRIAAMAARLPIFSLHRLPPLVADVGAVRRAAEIPYSGPAFADPEREVFATSRITAAGRTFAEARGKIERALVTAREGDAALASLR